MGSEHKRKPRGNGRLPAVPPSLDTLLGTTDRAEQIRRVAHLLQAAHSQDAWILITFNAMPGAPPPAVRHAPFLDVDGFKFGLDVGHRFLVQQEQAAAAEAARQREEALAQANGKAGGAPGESMPEETAPVGSLPTLADAPLADAPAGEIPPAGAESDVPPSYESTELTAEQDERKGDDDGLG